MHCLLTIDIGTTNWKVALFSEAGVCLGRAKRSTVQTRDGAGLPYYAPEKIRSAVAEMIAELRPKMHGGAPAAVSVTSMGESVVPIGEDGTCLHPIIPWFDARSAAEAAALREAVGGERLFRITGQDGGAFFSVPKMLWMRAHHPDVFGRAVKWLQMSDFINYLLTGRFVTDYSMASRTLALNMTEKTWSQDVLDACGLSKEVFPEILPAGSCIGTVTAAAAAEFGLPAGVPVVMGGHDHPVATIAGQVFGGGAVFDSSGTAEPYLTVSESDAPLPDAQLGQRYSLHPDPRRYVVWGGITSSGASVDWAVRQFAPEESGSYDALFARVREIPAGSEGVLFQPHLRGSGAPHWDVDAKGAFLGLRTTHTRAHMLRAVLEGLCYQARVLLDMHEALSGAPVTQICCMGGGARITAWQQIKADVTGCTVLAGADCEASALGAAMLAATGIGLYPDLQTAAAAMQPKFTAYAPTPQNRAAYQGMQGVYEESYRALKDINRRLSMGW